MSNETCNTATIIAAGANSSSRIAMDGLASGTGSMLNRFLAWRLQRKAIRDLQRLSDYELRDIGLSRGEIEWAVTHSGPRSPG